LKKFVEFNKRSKKEQKRANAEKRGTWGQVKAYGSVVQSKKVYNRKRDKKVVNF
jgi:hypothetical protein